ncbi:MAG: hypothetical protein K6E38_02420 [Fretibacterium sp.]|nr:hypothetical protein [Fretibacterium sp.]
MNKYSMFFLYLFLTLTSCAWAEKRTIIITNGESRIEFELNDTSVADSLWNQLPFSAGVENYGDNEKIFHPTEPLDTSNVQENHCPAGTLAYFFPWGNLVMYYGSAPLYPGLYILGHATLNADSIKDISGTIDLNRVTEARQDSQKEKREAQTGAVQQKKP